MFTGIIEEIGTVKSLDKRDGLFQLQIAAKTAGDIRQGQSVCVNGVCLTVSAMKVNLLSFEIMPETIKYSNLGQLKSADKVNLERALSAHARFDGHLVSGHIDGTGTVGKKELQAFTAVISVNCPLRLLRYIVHKGSVALDGVSLTVSAVTEDSFTVGLIPYTLKNTTLDLKRPGDVLNIECDLLAKYTDKLLSQSKHRNSNITNELLKEHGFI